MAKWCNLVVAKATGDINISIFDEIGAWGYSAADFARDLGNAGNGAIKVKINSPGGDVFQGFAIYNILNRVRDRVTVTVEGLAASMGSVITMAAKTVIMPANAMMMIHDPSGVGVGGPEEMASFAEALNKMRDGIVKAYVDKTGLAEDKIRQMMAKETWLSADEAVNMGFADQVEQPIQMAARGGFDLSCYRNVPQSFGTSTTENETMKKEEIARLCTALGLIVLAKDIPEGKTFEEVMALVEKAQKDAKDKADAEAAAARAAEGKEPTVDDIRAELHAEMTEIRSLCSLAGMADKADGFITAKKSVKEVIAALAEAKKADEEAGKNGKGKRANASATEVNARHNPNPHAEGSSAVALDPSKVWDKFNSTGKAKK